MAFKKLVTLDAETTISLGGKNKKTGKNNPVRAEGYFLGSKTVADAKKKSGISYIHILSTPKGNLGVWGKTNLDNKMKSVNPGIMVRLTQDGMQTTPNGEMYLYTVEVDDENTIDVGDIQASAANDDSGGGVSDEGLEAYEEEDEEVALGEDEAPADEVKTARPSPAARPTAQAPDAARQAKVQAMLKGARKTA